MARVQREYWRKRNQFRVYFERAELAVMGLGLFGLAAGIVLLAGR